MSNVYVPKSAGILDISDAEYFSIPALSNSGMKDLAVSPLRYWHCHLRPDREEEKETPALKLGSAFHCALLEGGAIFTSRYARAIDPADLPGCLVTMDHLRAFIKDKGHSPRGTRKEDAVSQALAIMEITGESVPILDVHLARFHEASFGKIVLTKEEWTRTLAMAEALRDEPALRPILAEGKAEVAMYAIDPETGVPLKCKLDWFAPRFTFDAKSFTQMRGKSIDQTVNDACFYEGYFKQAAFYQYVRCLVTGEKPKDFQSVWGFVESDEPHETRIRTFRETKQGQVNTYWNMAKSEIRRHIHTYAENMNQFGDKPWRFAQDVETMGDEDMKQILYA